MSMNTAHGTPTVLNKDRRTVPQLLAAAAKDTDAASVFYDGTGPADYDRAIVVIKGRENVEYVVAMLARQQLVTPGKPVEGSGIGGVQEVCRFPDCKCPMDPGPEPDWCARGLPHATPGVLAVRGETARDQPPRQPTEAHP
jgi:hypothetical protein